jgi:hypothetical protein
MDIGMSEWAVLVLRLVTSLAFKSVRFGLGTPRPEPSPLA